MNPTDELVHQIKLAAGQQAGNYRPFVYGHVSLYDAANHRVQVMLPSIRDDLGRPVQSAWMPLASIMVGNGFGFQWAPHGGASYDNPTAGEPIEVHIVERNYGSTLAAHPIFNVQLVPPFTDLLPGEFGFKHESGSLLKFNRNGSVQLITDQDLAAVVGGNMTATVSGDLEADVTGTATLSGENVVLHGNTSLSTDINGFGTRTTFTAPNIFTIDAYETGAVVVGPLPHTWTPPKLPDP